ncbi:hypothetical protein RRF57_013245 [Xylaria bambusicola]|uniref:Uncharacterized protein n=1 Tax=Xylaria bambusicola TaxID=326684 RepID=A0AAN7URD2_9PEZI
MEREFIKLWNRDDHSSRFMQGQRDDSDELELWKMMLIRYECIPPHLFTYGLRLGVDCYERAESLMLSSKASYLLQKICVHPVWRKNINELRSLPNRIPPNTGSGGVKNRLFSLNFL